MKKTFVPAFLALLLLAVPALAGDFYIVKVHTADMFERAQVADAGYDITSVDLEKGWMWVRVPVHQLTELQELGFKTEIADVKTLPAGYEDYHDYAELVAELQDIADTYPQLTSLFSIGQSIEGRELWCLKISDNPDVDETDEPAFSLVALHHAREILTIEVALHTIHQLLDGYGQDEQTTYYVDNREIYVIPNLNPDGSEHDHSGGWFGFWRKNRRVNGGSPCMGVDLNRNYGYLWGGVGSSGNPCSDTYRGTEAFSEPETVAYRDFLIDHPNVTTLISLHTHAKLVLYPWGHTYTHIEDQTDYLTHKTLAEIMASFNKYTPTQASSLYPTTGDTTDWSYGELGIISFTFELEPSQLNPLGFYPQPSIIPGACERNYDAIYLALGLSRDPSLVLAADLWRLDASLNGMDVLVEWASIVETEAAGWNVLRAEAGTDAYQVLNNELIQPGQVEYAYTDDTAQEGKTYDYLVEFVSNYDNDQQFGPVTVPMPGAGDDDVADDDVTDDDVADDDVTDDDIADDDATDDDLGDDDGGDDDEDNADGGCGC